VIELRNVHKKFGRHVVLDGVNFSVAPGETVALLGPSGSGKSVLLKHIIGLMRPDAGDVLVEGQSVPHLPRKALAVLRARIGYAFQTGALFDSMTVFENIRLGISDDHCYRDRSFCRTRVAECLRMVNLSEDVARLMPAELSGGMRKRVGIARAVAGNPKYLLYDEPTSGLDPVNADMMDALIEGLQKQLHATSIVVSHDVRGSFRIADRIALLHNGRIRAVGTAEEFMAAKDGVVREFLERDIEVAAGGTT
jgi:phospholipid/cholesterol/gamma-HCH transport system ATP-binding protein